MAVAGGADGLSLSVSMPVLLSRVLGHLTAEVEGAGAGVGASLPSLAVWSNVVRCVADAEPAGGLTERALPAAARISSRLATAAITGSARRGWVSVVAGDGSKNRTVALTDAGRTAAEVWPARLSELDSMWSGTELRESLETLVSEYDLELPHFPASYGAADPSAIGAPFVHRAGPAEKGERPHGQDWKPVPRVGGRDSVTSVPITALLSQALMAFTIDYESRFPWPLASTLNVLCHVRPDPRPLSEVPGDHGIAGNGKSLLERHLIVTVTHEPGAGRGKRKMVALTDRGKQVLHHHPGRLEAVDAEWRERFGADLVERLRSELAALVSARGLEGPDYLTAPLHLG